MAYQPKSYRKFVATTATAAMVASAVAPVVSAAAGFTDVAPQYKDAIDFLVSTGATNGKTDTKFGVYDEITRLDAAVILAKVLKLDVDNAKDAGFTDVPKDRAKYVNALVDAGVLNGKAAGKFGAYDKLTRAEMAKIIANAYKLKGDDVTLPFTDVNDTWAPYVKALYKNGITKGKSETKFGANDNITRGDFAVFVYRAANVDVAPQVVSVSAINGKQIEIKFNKPVDKSALLDTASNFTGYTLKANKLELAAVDGANANAISLTPMASLSSDGKTLTIYAASGEAFNGK
ncbi:S-layer homology domain-containing protein [Geobacillus sp. 44B]|nr:S-layer homology domain-containing protein [Geobacillus sp. 44B]